MIPQPVPPWLSESGLHRTGRLTAAGQGLNLFYPAASYPHKNHQLLSRIPIEAAAPWPVESLVLTIPERENPNPGLSAIKCMGLLPPSEVIHHYAVADALVFPSLAESFGFPLVEAMWSGLPVVCADLPYARALCGSGAVYFDPHSAESLRSALVALKQKLDDGWWPDWREQLKRIPSNWDRVAEAFLKITAGELSDSTAPWADDP